MLCQQCDKLCDDGLRCQCNKLLCMQCYPWHECPTSFLPMWPTQERGVNDTIDALKAGEKAICTTAPTGGGKTRIASEITKIVTEQWNWRVALLTNRRILTRQGTKTLSAAGIEHGIIAAGYPMDVLNRVQVVSAQTLQSKMNRGHMDVPLCNLAIVDEAHRRDFDGILKKLAERGTARLGITATPIGIGDLYSKLIVAGTNSELRKCGALVRCDVNAPSEPDMKGVKMIRGEYVHKGMVQRVMQCICFADVFDSWNENNPWGMPTLLFAPGVPESKWFCEQFEKRGVKARHIDGTTDDRERDEIFEMSKEGELKVISSFGVLREGADLPWIRYGILVQVCGALGTYLQIVGRLLRAYPGKDLAILQDHSGAWHRHGSPNIDRVWDMNKSEKEIANERRLARQRGETKEPICCPNCKGVRMAGTKCPHCGHEHQKSVRAVRMTDGKLKKMVGDVIKPKIQPSNDERNWKTCLFSAGYAGQTLSQARGRFRRLTGRWLPSEIHPQPARDSTDWDRRAADVYPWLLKRKKAST